VHRRSRAAEGSAASVAHFDLLDSIAKRKNDDVRLIRTGLWALALGWTGPALAASTSSADTGYANFAFASELGSGIYEINGSTIQVYQVKPGYWLRYAERPGAGPGFHLVFPVTVGFFDFQLQDLAHLEIPTHIGALSLEPGLELDYWLREDWHVYPYAKGGATFASSSEVNAFIWDVGVRSDYRFSLINGADLWRVDFTHAAVHYHQTEGAPLPDDSFTRLRNGVEFRHGFGAPFRERRFEFGVYGVSDFYLDAPHGPASGISARTLQFETGLMFGLNPMYQLWGVPWPRIGIGYRDAGVLSGWRLVLGEPF
jgi:hypothetical protein